MTTISIRIDGKVQGVWFRKYTKEKCLSLGIKGWVRNNIDGSVQMVAQGEMASLNELIRWCNEGSPKSKVENVETQEMESAPYDNFEIHY